MPDTPELQARFGQPQAQRPGCGFPVAQILTLLHGGAGLLLEVVAAPPRSREMARAGGVHPALRSGDVLVGDRGFCSFTPLALLAGRGVQAVLRMHQRPIVDFTPGRPHALPGGKSAATGLPRSRWLRRLGARDQVVAWIKPDDRPDWMTAEQFAARPGSLAHRERRYAVGRPGFRTRTVTLVTTLVDGVADPLEALAEQYGLRGRVGLNLRHVKTTMGMEVSRCKTVDGVLTELTVSAIVYNLVGVVMLEASHRQGTDVERISFIDALRCLVEARPGDTLPALVVKPDRPGRVEPGVVKRRPKPSSRMTKPRKELREHLMEQ